MNDTSGSIITEELVRLDVSLGDDKTAVIRGLADLVAQAGRTASPEGLTDDALAFVQQGIRRMPQRYAVRVRLAMPAEDLAAQVGRWGTVSEDADGCLLEMNVDDLDWPVMVVAGSGAEFVVESTPELAERVAEVGARFTRTATT